jgi:hypothetical protein
MVEITREKLVKLLRLNLFTSVAIDRTVLNCFRSKNNKEINISRYVNLKYQLNSEKLSENKSAWSMTQALTIFVF